jgi:hypothetical protein
MSTTEQPVGWELWWTQPYSEPKRYDRYKTRDAALRNKEQLQASDDTIAACIQQVYISTLERERRYNKAQQTLTALAGWPMQQRPHVPRMKGVRQKHGPRRRPE